MRRARADGAAGHINHTLFWKNLAPASAGGGQLADGPFKDAIVRDFGSVESAFGVRLCVAGVLTAV